MAANVDELRKRVEDTVLAACENQQHLTLQVAHTYTIVYVDGETCQTDKVIVGGIVEVLPSEHGAPDVLVSSAAWNLALSYDAGHMRQTLWNVGPANVAGVLAKALHMEHFAGHYSDRCIEVAAELSTASFTDQTPRAASFVWRPPFVRFTPAVVSVVRATRPDQIRRDALVSVPYARLRALSPATAHDYREYGYSKSLIIYPSARDMMECFTDIVQ
jgi:hypothetical protein